MNTNMVKMWIYLHFKRLSNPFFIACNTFCWRRMIDWLGRLVYIMASFASAVAQVQLPSFVCCRKRPFASSSSFPIRIIPKQHKTMSSHRGGELVVFDWTLRTLSCRMRQSKAIERIWKKSLIRVSSWQPTPGPHQHDRQLPAKSLPFVCTNYWCHRPRCPFWMNDFVCRNPLWQASLRTPIPCGRAAQTNRQRSRFCRVFPQPGQLSVQVQWLMGQPWSRVFLKAWNFKALCKPLSPIPPPPPSPNSLQWKNNAGIFTPYRAQKLSFPSEISMVC